jgi:hypothetical protein
LEENRKISQLTNNNNCNNNNNDNNIITIDDDALAVVDNSLYKLANLSRRKAVVPTRKEFEDD